MEYARRLGVDWEQELVKVRNWCDLNKAKRTDWVKFWANWINRAAHDLAERRNQTVPLVRWADCAVPVARSEAGLPPPALRARLALLTDWVDRPDQRAKLPEAPAWLGTPQARALSHAQLVADLDGWIAEAVRRNPHWRIPQLPSLEAAPASAAAE